MNTRINDRMPDQMLDLYHLLLAEFGPQYWWPAETEFEMIVGALLTQQTRWESVERAIANLKARSLLTPAALTDTDQETIEECIRCTGFYRQKAERLQLLSQYFNHNGKPIFVIDAYTKRICECIGVTGGYETLQKQFEDSLPRDTHLYQEFHALIVLYGKEYCTRKRCDECIIARV
jgi:endonuclease-3 related protein